MQRRVITIKDDNIGRAVTLKVWRVELSRISKGWNTAGLMIIWISWRRRSRPRIPIVRCKRNNVLFPLNLDERNRSTGRTRNNVECSLPLPARHQLVLLTRIHRGAMRYHPKYCRSQYCTVALLHPTTTTRVITDSEKTPDKGQKKLKIKV